jgi:hypothetical protein
MWIWIFVALVGRVAALLQKRGFLANPNLDPMAGVWYMHMTCAVLVTLYVLLCHPVAVEQIQATTWRRARYFVCAAACISLYSITATPLLKSLEYSSFALMAQPIGLAIGLIVGVFLLGDTFTPTKGTALALFLVAGWIIWSSPSPPSPA